jgi:hypothetical protein
VLQSPAIREIVTRTPREFQTRIYRFLSEIINKIGDSPCPQSSFGEALTRLWPHGDRVVPGLVAGTIASAPAVFAKYSIVSDLVIAHAMAQFSEECGCGGEMMEDMSYSAARLLQVFPRARAGGLIQGAPRAAAPAPIR